MEEVRIRVFHPEGGKLMVKRSEQDASDINVIMRRWKATGVAPVVGEKPRYGDFSAGVDFHAGLNQLQAAQAEFDALPAEVRKRVDNDPGKFLDLALTVEGREELNGLGLDPDRVPGVDQVEPDPPPADPPAVPE